ncbi:MAG TPA: hypothetical protein VGC84_05030 [Ilumatobacteraceae bacterium]
MTIPPLSPEEAERLISAIGAEHTEHVAGLNAVLAALRSPGDGSELGGAEAALSAFTTAAAPSIVRASSPLTRPSIHKLLTARTLATIGVLTLVSAGAAAAAGGLPMPFAPSRPSASATTEVIESTDDETEATEVTETTVTELPTTAPTQEPTTSVEPSSTQDVGAAPAEPVIADVSVTESTEGIGPDVNGPAKFGLCTAFAAQSKHDANDTADDDATAAASDDAVPFQSLSDAAAAAGQTVEEFCADAVPGGSVQTPDGSKHSDDSEGSDDSDKSTSAGDDHGDSDASDSASEAGHGGDREKSNHGHTDASEKAAHPASQRHS